MCRSFDPLIAVFLGKCLASTVNQPLKALDGSYNPAGRRICDLAALLGTWGTSPQPLSTHPHRAKLTPCLAEREGFEPSKGF
jgi:hypothetical protein